MDEEQLDSISDLCGQLRSSDSIGEYLANYDWTETDIAILRGHHERFVDPSVNLFVVGPSSFYWTDTYPMRVRGQSNHFLRTDSTNTERELSVSSGCPFVYRELAPQLSSELNSRETPPAVFTTSRGDRALLVETTSGKSVGMRIELPPRVVEGVVTTEHPVALFLAQVPNLSDWFAAFLTDLNESDPSRVPQLPPRLTSPSDWYTPEERHLSAQIEKATADINALVAKRERLQTDLAEAEERGNRGVRRGIWADGEDLVAAVTEILRDFGFDVQDMDAGLEPNEQKYEDLRLTIPNQPDWEAIAEVKGYGDGTKTRGNRQINEYVKRFIRAEGREPDIILWIANPYRNIDDPSSRPLPGGHVEEAAASIDAVHVLTTDLYRLWVLVQTGELQANHVVQDLISASLGLWSPSGLGSDN